MFSRSRRRVVAIALMAIVVGDPATCGESGEHHGHGTVEASHSTLTPTGLVHFKDYPVYWAGRTFERWPVVAITGPTPPDNFLTIVYGHCEPEGGDEPSCTPPLQIQIMPLCNHLDAVGIRPFLRRASIRGAPVGVVDDAPVLLTTRTQVKVYADVEGDARLALRVLQALRSANSVAPVVQPDEPIPGPSSEQPASCG